MKTAKEGWKLHRPAEGGFGRGRRPPGGLAGAAEAQKSLDVAGPRGERAAEGDGCFLRPARRAEGVADRNVDFRQPRVELPRRVARGDGAVRPRALLREVEHREVRSGERGLDEGGVGLLVGQLLADPKRLFDLRGRSSICRRRPIVSRYRQALRAFAALDTLEFLKRSGRMNGAVAAMGTLLQLKPILTMSDGKPDAEHVPPRPTAQRNVCSNCYTRGGARHVRDHSYQCAGSRRRTASASRGLVAPRRYSHHGHYALIGTIWSRDGGVRRGQQVGQDWKLFEKIQLGSMKST